MKTLFSLSFLLVPIFLAAQINSRAFEITQRQKFYKTGDWSSWLRSENASYRYHWGLNPVEDSYKEMLDATFEIRNEDNVKGWWQIQILVCNSNEVITKYDRLIQLEPNELKTIAFSAPNCGSLDAPLLRYQIRRMIKID